MKITFTPTHEYAKFFPPVPTKKDIPDWYRDLDVFAPNSSMTAESMIKNNDVTPFTVKRCPPVMDYLSSGYSIKFPFDLMFSVSRDKDGGLFFSYRFPRDIPDINRFGTHPFGQFPIIKNGKPVVAIKFSCGWVINTPAGYSCLIYPNFYSFEDRFSTLPAIVDTDQFDNEIGFIAYVDSSKEGDFKIDAGTTIATLFPFKREGWNMDLKTDLFDFKKSKAATYTNQFFEGMYKRFFHNKKKYD